MLGLICSPFSRNCEAATNGLFDFESPEDVVALANYIKNLEDQVANQAAEITDLKIKVIRLELERDTYKVALEEERQLVQIVLADKDKLLDLKDQQLKELTFLYENNRPSTLEKWTVPVGAAILVWLAAKIL